MLTPMLVTLQLRDLRVRDAENVVTYGGHNLQKLAAAVPEEERKSTDTGAHVPMTGWFCCLQTVSSCPDVLCSVVNL